LHGFKRISECGFEGYPIFFIHHRMSRLESDTSTLPYLPSLFISHVEDGKAPVWAPVLWVVLQGAWQVLGWWVDDTDRWGWWAGHGVLQWWWGALVLGLDWMAPVWAPALRWVREWWHRLRNRCLVFQRGDTGYDTGVIGFFFFTFFLTSFDFFLNFV